MSLIKFLLFRNKKTSLLASQQYGKIEQVQPKETSVLAYRQYGKYATQNQNKQNEKQALIK